jgi:hypothetical protein
MSINFLNEPTLQVCEGDGIDEKCPTSVSNRKHGNSFLNYQGAALRNTSKCDGCFIYIKQETSNERWLILNVDKCFAGR